ncbi:MAG: McrC family protein [Desulfovibrio sp.]|nr:McrC family protein [Desulfovibrio sp.]
MNLVSVREFAELVPGSGADNDLDHAGIPPKDFDWLARLCDGIPALGSLRGRNRLKLGSLVGALALPGGGQLEILPKTARAASDAAGAASTEAAREEERGILCKMLRTAMDVSGQEAGIAEIEKFPSPLTEWVATQFLLRLQRLVRSGLRHGYVTIKDERPYLRGRLDVHRQALQLPHRRHLFHIRHHIFLPDRPENRLLKSALLKAEKAVRQGPCRRLGGELAQAMETVPASRNIPADFACWGLDRLMADYAPIRPWCALVLGNHMPFAITGAHTGMSFLFSMHVLFEKYVAAKLSGQLWPGVRLESQKGLLDLCTHEARPPLRLRPDITLTHPDGRQMILDTKWKCLERWAEIATQDIYQLYAYGQRCLDGRGDLALIYPDHEKAPALQNPVKFEGCGLFLHLLRFNMKKDVFLYHPSFPAGGYWRT